MPNFTYRPAEPGDLDVVNRILADAFTSSDEKDREGIAEWTAGAGSDGVRTFESDGRIVGTTRLIEMGQYFGGKRVEMTGIAGVAVTPESRATGAGRVLMDETLREMRANGTPISVLYASTSAFYRKVGYETAGASFFHRVPLSLVPRTGSPLRVREYDPSDQPSLEACYEASVRGRDGALARGDYIWGRIRKPRGAVARGFVFEHGTRGIEGYIFQRQRPIPNLAFPMELFATDLCATTTEARDTLFGHLRGFSSMCSHLVYESGASHPFALALAQQSADVRMHEYWMLRVVDVKKALEQRGYPRAGDAELCFELLDDALSENAGVWTLTVAGGRAIAERGGTPTMTLDARALAAMYSGFASARALRVWSSLGCEDERTLATCDALFRGPTPGMGEMF